MGQRDKQQDVPALFDGLMFILIDWEFFVETVGCVSVLGCWSAWLILLASRLFLQ